MAFESHALYIDLADWSAICQQDSKKLTVSLKINCKTEYDMKNCADPEGLVDNTLQDLHNIIQKKPSPIIDL